MKITIKNVEKLSKVPVESLYLNDTRAYNCIKRAKYNTIGDILEDWDHLDKIPKAGIKTIIIIKNAVINYYLENASEAELCTFLSDFQAQYVPA